MEDKQIPLAEVAALNRIADALRGIRTELSWLSFIVGVALIIGGCLAGR